MSSIDEIRDARIKKLELLRKEGINPYPGDSKRELSLKDAIAGFDSLEKEREVKWIAGRVMSIRGQGAIIFITLYDGTGEFQGLFKKDVMGDDKFDLWNATTDIGDFVEIQGSFFTTKRGEKTLEAKDWRMLAKSLRSLPEKWHGLQDEEIKLRKRYLDILTDPKVKQLFIDKNIFWSSMREFMVKKGFLELEMPVLEAVPGGAEAEPFVTHHKALDTDFYLRISLELPLKKMLVAGYEKVFEIGRIFRNEGISSTHLQDYTQMEFYSAYADFDMLMDFIQEMYQYVIEQTFKTLKITANNIECDWSGTWEKKNYVDLFREWTGIDLESATDGDLKKYLDKHKVAYEKFIGRGRLIDLIFKRERKIKADEAEKSGKEKIEKQKPFFLINQPVELEPLAKRVEGNPKFVQRMQIMAYYLELGKGFGELNDPLDQHDRFLAQMKLREAGDNEAQMLDTDYVEAMEYGMPPCVGFGVSERLFSVLVERPVRETVIFPPMKPKQE
ncbi:MAG: lysine--tRNA ligase [bacterium]|nr:lysine--tRNA ligase [bacterium]